MLLILITLISVYFTPSQLLEESTFKVNSNYNRPVIGILTLPDDDTGNRTSPSNFPASYVKFIESAGARVLPVFIGRDEDYYKSIMNITNGMLFTGGSTNLRDSIYTSTASIIWSYALQLNQAGDYYPLWGTCQGFELFLYLVNDQQWPLVSCSAINLAGKVTFLLDDKQLKETKLFKNAPNSIIKALAKDPVTFNWHDWCLPVGYMHLPKLQDFFTAMSKSVDYKGLEFISMIEAKDFPFYGVQFHPEKPPYEPVINPRYTNTPQTLEAILVSQYFSNFFISETRKSHHIYPETEYYRSQLIYNYCPQYTGINASASNVETYYFY